MTENEHQPRVDAMTDEPQTEGMQPTEADGVARPEQPPMNDAADRPDVDDESRDGEAAVDIAETPSAS